MGLCRQNSILHGTLVDHPNTCKIAAELISTYKLSDRIDTVACNVADEQPPGQYDMAVIRNFIQVQSRSQARAAIGNTANTINPGGRLVIWGWVIAGVLAWHPKPMVQAGLSES